MQEAGILKYLTDTFAQAEILTVGGTSFVFFGDERMMPFVTLVSDDEHDQASNLNRPGVFRLNIGVRKATFQSLFPDQANCDFTELDRLMPHPVYGAQHWVCILSPADATFEQTVKPLLAEAYQIAASRHAKGAARG